MLPLALGPDLTGGATAQEGGGLVGPGLSAQDAFLTEVEIRAPGSTSSVRISSQPGFTSPDPAPQLRPRAGLGLIEGFWEKSDNCGTVVMDGPWQPDAEPSITLQAEPPIQHS